MFVYAGIDEAGYGPIFGPLVIARSVFSVPEELHEGTAAPCLWRLLKTGVCRSVKDSRNRIAVNDSKLLYSPARGMALLERGVLSFLNSREASHYRLDALARALAVDVESYEIGPEKPWYIDRSGGPDIPVRFEKKSLARSCARMARLQEKTGVQLEDAGAAVIFEDRFNRLVGQTGTKSGCAWRFVASHLESIWERWGVHNPLVVIDRQGGRKNYESQIEEAFPKADVSIVQKTFSASEYTVLQGNRRMRIRVQIDSESSHFPAAFASMTAKYLRELFLLRFHAFFSERAPEVKPTYGYFGDGKRFLTEIRPLLNRLSIDESLLVRCC